MLAHKTTSCHRIIMAMIFGMAAAAPMGCSGESGPERSAVQGTVSLDGTPIERGTIVFLPQPGVIGPAAGGDIINGQFNLPTDKGPVPGAHQVQIKANRTEGTIVNKGVPGAVSGPSAGGSVEKIVMYIPERYNTKSELVETIKSGKNELKFELSSAP